MNNKISVALTDTAIKNAKPKDKPYKLSDSKGLFALINPTGSKLWKFKYRVDGKEKQLAFGCYPDVTLKIARQRRDDSRNLLAEGVDPSAQKATNKQAKKIAAENSFEAVTMALMEELKTRIGQGQYTKKLARMRNDVFPWLGKKPMMQIKAPDVFDVMKRIDSRSARYTARRVCAEICRVFRFANGRGIVESNPTIGLLDSFPPCKEKNLPAIIEPTEVAKLLRAIDAFSGTFPVLCALKLAPMVFVRPGELRKAKWKDIDLERGEWGFHVTKTDTPHIVPLSKQAIAILKELHPLTGRSQYVFPGRDRKKSMSESTINAALQRMGYDTGKVMTGHGFRAMARTILHEVLEQKQEAIEHQLAHKVPDALGTAYNRTKFLKERKEMMQIWADYLEKLKSGAL